MNNNGLLKAPELDNVEKYLNQGERTQITPERKKEADSIVGTNDGMVVRNIIVWMHKKTKRLDDPHDKRKFKRSASEILDSKERTGCCDSSTLFTTLARCKGIPTIQVIGLDKECCKKNVFDVGHYFAACYIKDARGNASWVLIDPDIKRDSPEEVKFRKFDRNNRNLPRGNYAFAYVIDYNELGINSEHDMENIQRYAFSKCDIRDFVDIDKREDKEKEGEEDRDR